MKNIAYSRVALKALSRMPLNTAKLIRSKIVQYAENSTSQVRNVVNFRAEMDIAFVLRTGV